MSRVMPHHLHCEIETQHLLHAEAEQIHLYFYLHFFSSTFSSLSLLNNHLKCYFLSLCCAHQLTLGNLHACTCACRVENLICTKKKVHACVHA